MLDLNVFKVGIGQHLPFYSKLHSASKHVREFVCYHQGKYSQYDFGASKKHQDLKVEVLKESVEIPKIADKLEILDTYLDNGMHNAYQESFKLIIGKYFNGRSEYSPRACVKAHNEKGEIVDLYRDRYAYQGTPCSRESNTGFSDVYSNGKEYLCNNLPRYAKQGVYVNPRLDKQTLKNYKLSFFKNKFAKGDNEWINCWNPINNVQEGTRDSTPAETCYKSTLIIPMTLLGNELDPEFKKHFKIGEGEKAIWGYLCFDHRMINYFNKTLDVDCGYIFADIMSFYLITRLNYSDFSKTYDDAQALIERERKVK